MANLFVLNVMKAFGAFEKRPPKKPGSSETKSKETISPSTEGGDRKKDEGSRDR